MSMLRAINYLLQWTFFRLARVTWESDVTKTQRWCVIGPVVPLTGWRTPYIPKSPRVWVDIPKSPRVCITRFN